MKARLRTSIKNIFFFPLVGLVITLLSTCFPVYGNAGIYEKINFQGKLVNFTDGTNVSNTSYTFTFTLYDASSAGTNLWTEDQSLTVTDGIFRASLGSVTPFGATIFDNDNLFLGIKVNGGTELSPRIRFSATAYAMNAKKVNGLNVTNTNGTLTIPTGATIQFGGNFTTSGSNALTITTSNTTNATLPAGTITLADLTTAQSFTNKTIGSTGLIFSGASTDITTGTNEHFTISPNGLGNIGIGTTNPLSFFSIGNTSQFQINSSGAIIATTGITSSGSIQFSNLTNGLLLANGSGVLSIQSTSSFEIPLTFSNGLTRSSNTIQLGGTLSKITEIAMGGYNFGFTGAGNVGIGTTGTLARLALVGSGSTTGFNFRTQGNTGVDTFVILDNGNVGIGTTSPGASLAIGAGATSPFMVNNSGNITRINNVAYSFPSESGGITTYLKNDGSGNLTWSTASGPSGGVTTIENEGVALASQPNLNFIGAGIDCVNNAGGGQTDCTVRGDGTIQVEKDASESVVSNATLQNDDALLFAMSASTAYFYEIDAKYTANTTGDIRIGATGPAGSTYSFSGNIQITQITGAACAYSTGGTGCIGNPSSATGMPYAISVSGLAQAGANAGNFNFTWAQSVSNAAATIVEKNSILRYRELNGAADLAEVYYSANTAEPGEVMVLDSTVTSGVKRSIKAYDPSIIGVVSTKPAIVIGDKGGYGNPIAIALSGRVPVKVSTENGAIVAGDYLTSSSITGVAMKATKAGPIIGLAMESYDGADVGKVLTFIKTAYNTGTISPLFTDTSSSDKIILDNLLNDKAKIKKEDLSYVVTDRVVAGLDVIAPEITTQHVSTDLITSSLDKNIRMLLDDNGAFIISNQNASDSAVFSVDSQGSATLSGTLDVKEIRANKINGIEDLSTTLDSLSNRIENLEMIASQSAPLNDIPILSATQGSLLRQDGLIVSEATVSGHLNVGGNTLVEGILNVINTITGKNIIIEQWASFLGSTSFKDNVLFGKRPTFNRDTAGYVTIPSGQENVRVSFKSIYDTKPIVVSSVVSIDEASASANILLQNGYQFIVSDITNEGFTVKLNKPANRDIVFSWIAFSAGDIDTPPDATTSAVLISPTLIPLNPP